MTIPQNKNHEGKMTSTAMNRHIGWFEILNRRYAASLLLVSLGVWLHAANGLLMATMVDQVLDQIGGHHLVAWTVATYHIGSIVTGATAALLSERHGLRKLMSICAAVFAAGCAVSMLAPNMPILLVGRALQGLGAGGLVALSFVAINILFPTHLSARVIAVISALWGASAFLGPLIGAYFVEYLSWRWGFAAFLIQAVILAVWVLRIPVAEPDRPENKNAASIPTRRLTLLTVGVTLIAASGIKVTYPATPLMILIALAMLLGFIALDNRAEGNRMLPRNAFRLGNPAGAALLMWLGFSIGTVSLATYGPILLAELHNVSPVWVGYILAGASFGWSLAAMIVSGSPERLDKFWICAGLCMVSLVMVALVFAMPTGPVWLIAILSVLQGAAFGSAYTFILRRAQMVADDDEVARVAGALPTVSRFGFAAGAAFCGVFANAGGYVENADTETLLRVTAWVFIGGLPFILLGLVGMAGFIWPRTRKHQPNWAR